VHLLTLTTVMVATDLDDASLPALRTARALAHAAGAALHVVYVSDVLGTPDTLHAILRRAGFTPADCAAHTPAGDPARVLAHLADEIEADVLVLGPHRQQRETGTVQVLGSTALGVVTISTVPCLVIAQPLRLPLERVVVAVDMSDTARGALVVGLSWASALRAPIVGGSTTLTALHVSASKTSEGSILERELERVRSDAGTWAGVAITAETVVNADAAAGIAAYANDHRADLVVLGTRGLGQPRVRRLGSVSEAVMKAVEMPVLLVPPAVWVAYARGEERRRPNNPVS
jgi:nucleotide-binding universal stress UspA family protein